MPNEKRGKEEIFSFNPLAEGRTRTETDADDAELRGERERGGSFICIHVAFCTPRSTFAQAESRGKKEEGPLLYVGGGGVTVFTEIGGESQGMSSTFCTGAIRFHALLCYNIENRNE